jgi:hypothetical protein
MSEKYVAVYVPESERDRTKKNAKIHNLTIQEIARDGLRNENDRLERTEPPNNGGE